MPARACQHSRWEKLGAGDEAAEDGDGGVKATHACLQDRKEEILSELGDIVGSSAANAIGDLACQQAATVEKFSSGTDMEADQLQDRCCVKYNFNLSTSFNSHPLLCMAYHGVRTVHTAHSTQGAGDTAHLFQETKQ